MPWKRVEPMDQKIKLINGWLDDIEISTICQDIGISRKTAYKWITRYKNEGIDGLKDKSRAAKCHPNETEQAIQNLIVDEKIRRPKWGPRKILKRLEDTHPDLDFPVPSTAGMILQKHGLVKTRTKRKRTPPYNEPFIDCSKANAVWSIDYKGQFYTLSKQICYPLTVTDNYSRFLLEAKALQGPRYLPTRSTMEILFREYGLPDAIRSDNGTPFASNGLGGLSRLSVWWIKLGIRPERIDPGKPTQNGRHERMHRTLKEATAQPPEYDFLTQQKSFDRFRSEYNYERPHEAIEMKYPAQLYRKSERAYFEPSKHVDYDSGMRVLKVRLCGQIKLKGKHYYISDVLIGEYIGLKQVDDDIHQIFFSFQPIGIINTKRRKLFKSITSV